MSLSKEDSEKLEEFRGKVSTAADYIVFHVFPSKIFELTTIIESPDSPFNNSDASMPADTGVHSPLENPVEMNGPLPKRKRTEDGATGPTASNDLTNPRYPDLMRSNSRIRKLQEKLKKECSQLSDYCDKVKLWVNLTMPKIEDGDNFGVQIQEEVLSELLRSQESAYSIRDSVRQHYLARSKICSKLIKYPNLEDYTLALQEHDEKQLFFARQNLADIRNVYAVMTDILHKNMAKIRAPKGNNRAGLY